MRRGEFTSCNYLSTGRGQNKYHSLCFPSTLLLAAADLQFPNLTIQVKTNMDVIQKRTKFRRNSLPAVCFRGNTTTKKFTLQQ